MTSAYVYAESGGQAPPWLRLALNVEHYGAQAVLGRMLTVKEIYWMNAARRVYDAKRSMMQAENRAEWAKQHKEESNLLIYVEKLIADEEE